MVYLLTQTTFTIFRMSTAVRTDQLPKPNYSGRHGIWIAAPVQSLSAGLASFIREHEEAAKTKDVAQNQQAIDKSLGGAAADLTEAVEILHSSEDDLHMEATIMETDECSRYLQQRRMHRLRRGQFLLGHYDANASNIASPKRWIPARRLSGERVTKRLTATAVIWSLFEFSWSPFTWDWKHKNFVKLGRKG